MIVAEGFAMNFAQQITNCPRELAIPTNPKNIIWYDDHEEIIKEEIAQHLNDSDEEALLRYVGGFPMGRPPEGWPILTGYYVGYNIVKECLNEYTLQEIVSMDVDEIIEASGYFSDHR
jgi:uncharacterized protein YjaZ